MNPSICDAASPRRRVAVPRHCCHALFLIERYTPHRPHAVLIHKRPLARLFAGEPRLSGSTPEPVVAPGASPLRLRFALNRLTLGAQGEKTPTPFAVEYKDCALRSY